MSVLPMRRSSLLGAGLLLVLICATSGLSASAAGQVQAQPSTRTGGEWRPLPGGPRSGAIWAGSQLIVFDDGSPTSWDRYDLTSQTWAHMSESGAPSTSSQTASTAWTGTEILVWNQPASIGARYDPNSDTWRPMSSVGAPSPRSDATGVWTGSELLVWGGSSPPSLADLGDGAAYDPLTDRWRPIANNTVVRVFTSALLQ
jgi:hypothetical protein